MAPCDKEQTLTGKNTCKNFINHYVGRIVRTRIKFKKPKKKKKKRAVEKLGVYENTNWLQPFVKFYNRYSCATG